MLLITVGFLCVRVLSVGGGVWEMLHSARVMNSTSPVVSLLQFCVTAFQTPKRSDVICGNSPLYVEQSIQDEAPSPRLKTWNEHLCVSAASAFSHSRFINCGSSGRALALGDQCCRSVWALAGQCSALRGGGYHSREALR